MSWFTRASRVVADADAYAREIEPLPRVYLPTLIPSWDDFHAYNALWAKQVPSFTRGLKLITGTVAQLPFVEWNQNTPTPNDFLAQPEPDRPAWVTKQRTVEDLVLYGKAYWLVTKVEDGKPTAVKQLAYAECTRTERPTELPDLIEYDNRSYPVADPRMSRMIAGTVMEFHGYSDGVLMLGADALTTALALGLASRNYATVPMPSQVLKNTSTYELSDTEITEMLDAYKAARAESGVAYLNGGVELDTVGWSAADLALVDQRNQSDIDIARLLNLDPVWVGASVSGTSLVYSNRVDLRRDLIDLCLSDYIVPIEQRLSMPDASRGPVRADTSEFMRSNLDARVAMVAQLVPLNIITPDQAAAFLMDMPNPEGNLS